MRKAGSVLLALALVGTLAACGNDTQESTTKSETQEQTTTIEYMETPSSAELTVGTIDVLRTGYFTDANGKVYIGAEVQNTASSQAREYYKLTATAYDANNNQLAANAVIMGVIQPGETQYVALTLDCQGAQPDHIELGGEEGHSSRTPTDYTPTSLFTIKDVKEAKKNGTLTIKGQLYNQTVYEHDEALLVLFLTKDDQIVYAESTRVEDVPAHGALDFSFPLSVPADQLPDYDAVQVQCIDRYASSTAETTVITDTPEDDSPYEYDQLVLGKDESGVYHAYYNGQIATEFTGLLGNDHGVFYIENGTLNLDYTGTLEFQGKTYTVIGGIVQ